MKLEGVSGHEDEQHETSDGQSRLSANIDQEDPTAMESGETVTKNPASKT